MYKRNSYIISENSALTSTVYKMVLQGDTTYITTPGQFVEIELPGKFLRRPISVCDWDAESLTIIYKVVGSGTDQMSALSVGSSLDLLTGLGNGFDTSVKTRHPLLVGGGVGVPPLYRLCKELIAKGCCPTVVLGFNTADEAFYFEQFCALGVDVFVSTADATGGTPGLVTDAMAANNVLYDYLYACGPLPMLRALAEQTPTEGQFSFEERMGCGFGACVGCSMQTKHGVKRVCKEGPVFTKEEVIWE